MYCSAPMQEMMEPLNVLRLQSNKVEVFEEIGYEWG